MSDKLEYMSITDEERREYRDYMVSVHAAKDAIETAKEEGRAEGHRHCQKHEGRRNGG